MKKIILMILTILMISGCASRTLEEPVENENQQPTITAPVEETEPEQQKTVEIPVEIVDPEQNSAQVNWDVSYETAQEEGVVEDAVGYVYTYPVFSDMDGADTINAYYQDLMEYLSNYARETVYTQTVERHTVASIAGDFEIVAADEGLQLGVRYTVTVDFADTEEEESFDRTDVFHPDTGALLGTN